jgi:hypothetical protein
VFQECLTALKSVLLLINKLYCFTYSMDCLKNVCTKCVSFKEVIDVKEIEKMVKKIAEMLGLPPNFQKEDGIYILQDGTKVVCEVVETATWSDYCVECSAVL